MMAHGAATGVLHLELPADEVDPGDALGLLALAVADHLSLALANFNLRQRLLEQSVRDSLTGLFNRRYLYETIDSRIRTAAAAGLEVGVLMIDLDHFKNVNDRFGHAAGDTLLRAVADLLSTNVRDDDLVCRLGGEEFLLVVPGPGPGAIVARAERLAAAIRDAAVEFEGATLSATVSIGVATRPASEASGHDLMRAADEAMYDAKARGRDQVSVAQ
jgi:diguanylate cyclase (GGDEF)-like protein